MTLADQAAMTGQDGHVTSRKPGRPARRTFTAAYKARILAEFDATGSAKSFVIRVS
jgi:transposase